MCLLVNTDPITAALSCTVRCGGQPHRGPITGSEAYRNSAAASAVSCCFHGRRMSRSVVMVTPYDCICDGHETPTVTDPQGTARLDPLPNHRGYILEELSEPLLKPRWRTIAAFPQRAQYSSSHTTMDFESAIESASYASVRPGSSRILTWIEPRHVRALPDCATDTT